MLAILKYTTGAKPGVKIKQQTQKKTYTKSTVSEYGTASDSASSAAGSGGR